MRDSNGLDRAALDAWITREPYEPSEWVCETCEGSWEELRCACVTGFDENPSTDYPEICRYCNGTGEMKCPDCEEGVVHA